MKKLKLFRTALHAVIVMFVVSGIIACSSSSDSSVSEGEDSQLSSFRPARIDVDNGNDGTIDETFNLFYDAQGFLIRELIDVGADGNFDTEIIISYEDGILFSENFDTDGDGTIDEFSQFNYDGNGILLAKTSREALNGPLTSRTDYLQNTSGVLTGATFDAGANGSVDEVAIYRFNSRGTLDDIEFDVDLDNVSDILLQYNYGQFGEILTRIRLLADNSVTSVWAYVYEEGPCNPLGERQPRIATCVMMP